VWQQFGDMFATGQSARISLESSQAELQINFQGGENEKLRTAFTYSCEVKVENFFFARAQTFPHTHTHSNRRRLGFRGQLRVDKGQPREIGTHTA